MGWNNSTRAQISFSKPVPHGHDATRGYVVEVCVEAGESFLYTSDVQGSPLEEQLETFHV